MTSKQSRTDSPAQREKPSICRAEEAAVYVKNQRSANPRSPQAPAERVSISDSFTSGAGAKPRVSDDSRGLAERPAYHPQSPIPGLAGTTVRLSRPRASRPHPLCGRVAATLALLAIGLLPPAAAQADTPITSFSAVPGSTQAGGHPDVETHFSLEGRLAQQSQSACNCEDAKNATVHFPPGFIGNPHAAPQCSIADFSADNCPIDSQVGVVEVDVSIVTFVAAVYNVAPPPDDAGLLAFKLYVFNTPQFIVLSARTGGDYGLDATSVSIYHASSVSLRSYTLDLWGVPADPIHNALRLNPEDNPQGKGETAYDDKFCDANGAASTTDPTTIVKPCHTNIPPASSNSPLTPFTQNPTTCGSPLSSSLEVLSYDGGETSASDPWPEMTGCDQLSFNPSLYSQPTTTETDSPSGIDVNLSVPQEVSPTIPSPTEMRSATVTLPPASRSTQMPPTARRPALTPKRARHRRRSPVP